MYQIEVRATSEEYDVHAHQLAREIVALSTRQVPSLAAISASTSPLVIRTAQLYYLTGNLTPSQINQLTQQLLIDPVTQEAEMLQEPEAARAEHIVDVFFHPGVTDTLAESVLTGASMLGITGLERVETGKRYLFDQRFSTDEVRTITGEFLYNPVIQHYIVQDHSVGARFISPSSGTNEYPETTPRTQEPPLNLPPTYIQLTGMTGEQLLELSRAGLLALNLDEMRAIQRHYREQGREPTDVELETLAQTWSEHCSHKTFKATIHYREVDADGETLEQESIK